MSEKKSINRLEQSKNMVKELKAQLKAAEKRAILAEKTVKLLQADIDKKEGNVTMKNILLFKKNNNLILIDDCKITYFR